MSEDDSSKDKACASAVHVTLKMLRLLSLCSAFIELPILSPRDRIPNRCLQALNPSYQLYGNPFGANRSISLMCQIEIIDIQEVIDF